MFMTNFISLSTWIFVSAPEIVGPIDEMTSLRKNYVQILYHGVSGVDRRGRPDYVFYRGGLWNAHRLRKP